MQFIQNYNSGFGLWCFQQYFSYIMAFSFIGGENHRPDVSR